MPEQLKRGSRKCPTCGEESPAADWEFEEIAGTPPDFDDEDWYWVCPRCGSHASQLPEESA